MLTLEAIRRAVRSSDPYTQMDQLVRGEMAAGVRVADIFSALDSLLDEALATPGLTEDGEEALLGTVDALTGNCHRDCQYYDPPETEPRPVPRDARAVPDLTKRPAS